MAIEQKCANCRHFKVKGWYVSTDITDRNRVAHGQCRYPHHLPTFTGDHVCIQPDYHRTYGYAFRPTLRARIGAIADRVRHELRDVRISY